MHDRIIDSLTLDVGHARSVALDRDLSDPKALESYLVTPNAIAALKQIAEGIDSEGAQRAWKLVGPYGSGKSALGVFLGQLMAGETLFPHANQLLHKVSAQLASRFQHSNRYVLPLVGSRLSVGRALASSIESALTTWGKNRQVVAIKRHLDLEKGLYKGKAVNAAVGDLAVDFAEAALTQGFQGVLILIDEVGKFVEYAAMYPQDGDLIALQQLAEAASVRNDSKLSIVAMLHQHFASYAAGVGRALNDEWHKVASRFEEVPFDEPIERYVHFSSHAIKVKPSLFKNAEIADVADKLYSQGFKLGVLRAGQSPSDKALFTQPAKLYPLHPVSIATLAIISKRHGQSERSFHAFLKGNEPFALTDFAQKYSVDAKVWYRLPDVYDYLVNGYGLRFRDLSVERRWGFAVAAIGRHEWDAVSLNALKSIAVLELVQSDLPVAITSEFIAFACGERKSAVEEILERAVNDGVLVRRRKRLEYGFALSDAINIEALFESVAKTNEDELVLRGIGQLLAQRLIVANKHYQDRGTLRTMGVVVGSHNAWPKTPEAGRDEAGPDAWLKLVLLQDDEKVASLVQSKIKDETDTLSILGCLRLSAEGRAALAEFSIWQGVLKEVNSQRLDPWTSRYVEGRLQQANEAVSRLVTSALIPTQDRAGITYYYMGEEVAGGKQMHTSQLASWLFDRVYDQAPKIVNELINKDKPASAIVLARQRLFDLILAGDTKKPLCGPAEFPPERLIQSTLLRNTGIWNEEDGVWRLSQPCPDAQINITHIWAEISRHMQMASPRTFAEILDALAKPPFGLRAGPAGIWVALYLLINQSRCAGFERGTFVLNWTPEHFQRLFKNPHLFVLRELIDEERSQRLLSDYRGILASIGYTFERELTFVELSRSLYRWFSKLPEYSRQTTNVTRDAGLVRSTLKTAGDPIELLTHTLPEAHLQSRSKQSFSDWLTAALTSIGMAYRELQAHVTVQLREGLSLPGALAQIRNQLQAECAGNGTELASAELRAFILRCTDLSLTDEKWLDSLGSLLVRRPLDAWDDATVRIFNSELSAHCKHYRRWMHLVMERGRAPRAAERFVGLTLTLAGGEERSVFVATTDAAKAVSGDVLTLIANATNGDGELGIAALAQALMDLQGQLQNPAEENIHHG